MCRCISARLLPHEFNFAPIGAVAIFCGWWFHQRAVGILAPVVIAVLSDLLLLAMYGVPFAPEMSFVYGSYACMAFIGSAVRLRPNFLMAICGALAGSVTFFLLTNFGCWLMGFLYPETYNLYAQNLTGLAACYVSALPFYRPTLAGDMIFSTALFGMAFWLTRNRVLQVYEEEIG